MSARTWCRCRRRLLATTKSRGQRHGHRGDDWVEEAERGERQGGGVVAERPGEVAADGTEGSAGERDRVRDAFEVVAEQDQVRGADRDVGAGSEGQPEVGGGEGGGSLTPSPTMATWCPCACSRAMTAALSAGSVPAITSSMPTCAATALRGRLVVPGQQDGVQPEPAQPGDGGRRGRLDRVGDRDRALDRAVPADQHRACGRPAPRSGTARPGRPGRTSRAR